MKREKQEYISEWWDCITADDVVIENTSRDWEEENDIYEEAHKSFRQERESDKQPDTDCEELPLIKIKKSFNRRFRLLSYYYNLRLSSFSASNKVGKSRKMTKRELRASLLPQLEEAARSEEEFELIIQIWDKLDENRERKDRYHGFPVDKEETEGQDYSEYAIIPEHLMSPETRQIRAGYFIDFIFDCPFEMEELTSEKYISDAIRHLNQKRRELLYYMAIKQYTPKQIAELLGQTERNVRKCEAVMLKHLRADLLKGIRNKFSRGYTLLKSEKSFLERYSFSENVGLSNICYTPMNKFVKHC